MQRERETQIQSKEWAHTVENSLLFLVGKKGQFFFL